MGNCCGVKKRKITRNHLLLKLPKGKKVYLIRESLLLASIIRIRNY